MQKFRVEYQKHHVLARIQRRVHSLDEGYIVAVKYFNEGKLALVSNVGNLIEPVTKQQYLDWEQNGGNGIKLPPELFSHNDQSFFWQTSYGATTSGSGVSSGWGGRIADLMAASNSNPYVPITITLDGHSPWETAAATSQLGLNYWDGVSGFEGLRKED